MAGSSRIQRSKEHLEKLGELCYPDPAFYLNNVQKYFFRHESLRILRPGQYFRYFAHGLVDPSDDATAPLPDKTADVDHVDIPDDPMHRHYHAAVSALEPGDAFPGMFKIVSARRRTNGTLCVSRSAFIEPIGKSREDYYEQKLLLGLPWYCKARASATADSGGKSLTWVFHLAVEEAPAELRAFTMTDRVLHDNKTFEHLCKQYEAAFSEYACDCCEQRPDLAASCQTQTQCCGSCVHALGWHACLKREGEQRWRQGTLHKGKFDVASSLWSLASRRVPLDVMRDKLDEYIAAGLLEQEEKHGYENVFEQIQGVFRETNVYAQPGSAAAAAAEDEDKQMSVTELAEELRRREGLLQTLGGQESVD